VSFVAIAPAGVLRRTPLDAGCRWRVRAATHHPVRPAGVCSQLGVGERAAPTHRRTCTRASRRPVRQSLPGRSHAAW